MTKEEAPLGLIDLHHHFLLPEYLAELKKLGITGEGGLSDFPKLSPEADLAIMDRQSIAAAVASVSAPGVYFGDIGLARRLARMCNERMAEIAAQYPKRFAVLASLPLPDVDAALTELAYALDTLKMDGVMLLTNVDGRYLGDPLFEPLMQELDRRHVTVVIHPHEPPHSPQLKLNLPTTTVEFVFDTTRAVTNMMFSGTLEKYPHINYVLPHAGGAVPFLAWRLSIGLASKQMPLSEKVYHAFEMFTKNFTRDVLDEGTRGLELLRTRFYYDTALSATPFAFAALQALVGPERIVFGSDIPFAPEFIVAETISGLEKHAKLFGAGRKMVERENAFKLFPKLAERLIR